MTQIPARWKEVFNFSAWARRTVEHANEDDAWAALEADAKEMAGREVYIEEVDTGSCTLYLAKPIRVRVTGYETGRGKVNVNDDAEFVYIDPYVDFETLEDEITEESVWVYGRTHKWRKKP